MLSVFVFHHLAITIGSTTSIYRRPISFAFFKNITENTVLSSFWLLPRWKQLGIFKSISSLRWLRLWAGEILHRCFIFSFQFFMTFIFLKILLCVLYYVLGSWGTSVRSTQFHVDSFNIWKYLLSSCLLWVLIWSITHYQGVGALCQSFWRLHGKIALCIREKCIPSSYTLCQLISYFPKTMIIISSYFAMMAISYNSFFLWSPGTRVSSLRMLNMLVGSELRYCFFSECWKFISSNPELGGE